MACGVPIVGYDNEAFAGVHKLSKAGWPVPMGDHKKMAQIISRLTASEISSHAKSSLAFAKNNSFTETFKKRIRHMSDVLAK